MLMHREHAEVSRGVARAPLIRHSPYRSLRLHLPSSYGTITPNWYGGRRCHWRGAVDTA
jgi:hypothetical protein